MGTWAWGRHRAQSLCRAVGCAAAGYWAVGAGALGCSGLWAMDLPACLAPGLAGSGPVVWVFDPFWARRALRAVYSVCGMHCAHSASHMPWPCTAKREARVDDAVHARRARCDSAAAHIGRPRAGRAACRAVGAAIASISVRGCAHGVTMPGLRECVERVKPSGCQDCRMPVVHYAWRQKNFGLLGRWTLCPKLATWQAGKLEAGIPNACPNL